MDDDTPNTMNLDLNLGPLEPPTLDNESVNLEDWSGGHLNQLRDSLSLRQRTRLQRLRTLWRSAQIPMETRNIALDLTVNSGIVGGNDSPGRLQPREGSITVEERSSEIIKTCENNVTRVEDEELGKKEDVEKGNGEEGSFFDCNICLDLASEPVVTCCGHLFCWSCLYRWLNIHADPSECPVCKGEVTIKNVTPIYGRGNNTRELEEDSSLKIPQRPHALWVESLRQSIERNAPAIPVEEMIRHIGNRFFLTPNLARAETQGNESAWDLPERINSLRNRISISRGVRTEQNAGVTPDDAVNLTQTSPNDSLVGDSHRLSSRLLRRSYSHRAATISNLTSALSSAERILESYLRNYPVERNDDRDSVSSIAAVIHSESQTVDTAIDIDSTVSLSTASSRRRNDGSRVLDMDSADSRSPRRRRLN